MTLPTILHHDQLIRCWIFKYREPVVFSVDKKTGEQRPLEEELMVYEFSSASKEEAEARFPQCTFVEERLVPLHEALDRMPEECNLLIRKVLATGRQVTVEEVRKAIGRKALS